MSNIDYDKKKFWMDSYGLLYPKIKIDPTCLVHCKKMSEHICLYCCLCFKSLTPEMCHVKADGVKEDVCVPCAEKEIQLLIEHGEG